MSSFWDAFVDAALELLRVFFGPVEALVETYGNAIVGLVVSTPYPDQVFGPPTNGAWPNVYDYYWAAVIPLALALYGLMLGLVIFLESTSHLFGSYHRAKLKRRAFTGLLGILSWWWIAAFSLRLFDALAGFIVPDLSEITLLESASLATLGVLGIVLTQTVDLGLFVVLVLLYTMRQVGLYLFVLLMPLLIVFWIPGVGPFVLVSRFMTRLAGFYVPLLFMTVPVALLLRLGELLGTSLDPSLDAIGVWLLGLVIPFAAVLSPLVLFWQAGAFFVLVDRMGRSVSAERARGRFERVHGGAGTVAHGGRNFSRGVRGEPAITRDNQQLLDASRSAAHRAGTRVTNARTTLQSVFRTEGAESGSTDSSETERTVTDRSTEFDALRDRGARNAPSKRDRRDDDDDDTPRYIQ